MSQQLINHSADLEALYEDGYEIEVSSGYLILRDIPYVNSKKEVKLGILVSQLDMAGDITTKPGTHVAFFAGEYPCDKEGRELTKIRSGDTQTKIYDGLVVNYSFSSKPRDRDGYADYYEKMTTYVAIISGHAEAIEPTISARPCRFIESDDPESTFEYMDTASSHMEMNAVTQKLALARVGIVGLGGTGAYVLDLIAKTPIREIHLFDRDRFLQRNAFRCPGAPSCEELRSIPKKVDYLKKCYSRMHRNIVANDFHIDGSNIECLEGMDFVFLCMDGSSPKQPIIEGLEKFNVPFVDVGMGVELVDEQLLGIVRVTTSTVEKRDHIRTNKRINMLGGGADDVYSKNIQIADLNALNATLAVIKWKKLFGFYKDFETEHHCLYTIDGNNMCNEDQP